MSFVFRLATVIFSGATVFLLAAVFMKLPPKTPGVARGRARPRLRETLQRWAHALTAAQESKEARQALIACSIVTAAIGFILTFKIVFALLAGVLSHATVRFYRAAKRERQKELFENQLIEGLGIVRSSVRSGQSLGQALEQLVKDSQPPLKPAFAGVLHKVRLGVPLEKALNEMTEQIESNELRLAVLSMNLAKESGGNMGEILSRLSDTMRQRQKIRGTIKALTAQGKASGMVMSCIPFVLLAVLYLMEPDIMGLLFTTLAGNCMLAIIVAMVGIGAFFINRIVRIDI